MIGVSEPSLAICMPRDSAVGALNAVGLRQHSGYWFHELLRQFGSLLPQETFARILPKLDAAAMSIGRKKGAAAAGQQSQQQQDSDSASSSRAATAAAEPQ